MTIHLPKVNQFGGGNGGGGSSFPVTVTSSGSSLPATTGYGVGDTFLNTSDKKIYTTQVGGYQYNDNMYIKDTVSFEPTTSAVSSSNGGYARRYNTGIIWKGSNVSFKIHFKLFSSPSRTEHIFESQNSESNSSGKGVGITIDSSSNLYFMLTNHSGGSTWSISNSKKIFDYNLGIDKDFFLKITKNDTVASAELRIDSEDGEVVASSTFETQDWYTWEGYNSLSYVYMLKSGVNYANGFSVGKIFLKDTSWDFVIPDTTTLFWDSGTDITDKTEVADKTNGILYLYQDTELIQIPQNKNLVFTNVSASSWVSDDTYTDYGYKCVISNLTGVTENDFAQVVFAPTEADSGNYATVCLTGSGTVTIYSKVNDSITIPSIVVMGV